MSETEQDTNNYTEEPYHGYQLRTLPRHPRNRFRGSSLLGMEERAQRDRLFLVRQSDWLEHRLLPGTGRRSPSRLRRTGYLPPRLPRHWSRGFLLSRPPFLDQVGIIIPTPTAQRTPHHTHRQRARHTPHPQLDNCPAAGTVVETPRRTENHVRLHPRRRSDDHFSRVAADR